MRYSYIVSLASPVQYVAHTVNLSSVASCQGDSTRHNGAVSDQVIRLRDNETHIYRPGATRH